MNLFGNKIDSLLDTGRICNLIKYSQHCAGLGGYLAEFGTFRGGSLEIMALYNPGINILAVDSFEGIVETSKDDYHQVGDFSDLNVRNIIGYFSFVYPTVRIIKGEIPKAFEYFDEHTHFSFSHVDLDTKDSIYRTLDYLIPRTLTGGMILIDDYKVRSTPGCEIAINKFFEDYPETKVSFRGELKYFDSPEAKSHNQYLIVK